MTMCLLMHHVFCRVFWWNIKSPRLHSPDLVTCNFWLFPKQKSPLKGKRCQTIDEIQENMTGQLMVIGRTVWGPKVPTLKRTEASLSHVQCFLYLISFSINVSIFHITWLDTFWTDLICEDLTHVRPFKIRICSLKTNLMLASYLVILKK